jgi:hypothetical protein
VHAHVQRFGFSSQNGDRAWGVYYRRAVFSCVFLAGKKGLNTKDIHKEMFPVYGGKCLSRKAVHNCAANVSLMTKKLKRRCGSGWQFYAAGFDALVKRWGRCINGGEGYAKKCSFPGSNITCSLFYINLWPIYLLFFVGKPGWGSNLARPESKRSLYTSLLGHWMEIKLDTTHVATIQERNRQRQLKWRYKRTH